MSNEPPDPEAVYQDDETGRWDSQLANVYLPAAAFIGGGIFMWMQWAEHWAAVIGAIFLIIGGAAPIIQHLAQQNWRNIFDDLNSHVSASLRAARRLRIVARVSLLPEDITDADALIARLFPSMATCLEQRQTRAAFAQVAIMRPKLGLLPNSEAVLERKRYLMLLAETIAQLEYWGDDPLAALRRVKLPAAPRPTPVVEAQGLLGPVGAAMTRPLNAVWAYLSMGLGAASLVLLLLLWGANAQTRAARAEAEQAKQSAAGWQARAGTAEQNFTAAQKAQRELEEAALLERERSGDLMRAERARLERQKVRNEQRKADFSGPVLPDLNERLRQLGEPAGTAPVPDLPGDQGDRAGPGGMSPGASGSSSTQDQP